MSVVSNNNYQTNNQEHSSTVVSYIKIFGYMGIGLLITAIVALGLGAIFVSTNATVSTMNVVIIIAAILQIVLSLVISLVFLKGEHSILVPGILYCVTMGFLLSTFVCYLDWRLLGSAFGITALIFGLMTLIAFLSRKADFSIFLTLGMGLLIGAGVLSLVNMIVVWTTGTFNSLYWIVSFAVFAAVLFITMFDIWNIKKLTEAGAMNKNLELYCAFTIYVDFIMILLKVLYYLAIAYGRR